VAHQRGGIAAALQWGDLTVDQIGVGHMAQLRQPGADVDGVGIKFAGLGGGVENPQGFGIHAAAGTPLPAAVVGR